MIREALYRIFKGDDSDTSSSLVMMDDVIKEKDRRYDELKEYCIQLRKENDELRRENQALKFSHGLGDMTKIKEENNNAWGRMGFNESK